MASAIMKRRGLHEHASVHEWINEAYKPGMKACDIRIREWYAGRYQIDTFLGSGQTSVVFKSIDTRLDRVAALKLSNAQNPDLNPEILLKEAKYLARIEHPNIVRVFDFGLDTVSDLPWMTLEFLGARTLRNLIQETKGFGKVWASAAAMTCQICNIVEYIQGSVGLFQLDIKPDNLAVDGNRNLKLMDLGSASNRRNHFDRFGTPGYVAPELLESESVNQKCDVFSIGILLYELLTGHNPLIESQERQMCLSDREDRCTMAITIEVERTLPKPSSKYAQNFSPEQALREIGIPVQLVDLVRDMCATAPADRPSVADAGLALQKMLEPSGQPRRPSLFISHSHLDKERFVTGFAQAMTRRGFQVWLDERNLKAGEPFWNRIGAAIESCDFVIVILSENSLRSKGVLEELHTAHTFNLDRVKLLPIRIDAIDYSDLPPYLRARHILDFVGWEEQEILKKRITKLSSDILALWTASARQTY